MKPVLNVHQKAELKLYAVHLDGQVKTGIVTREKARRMFQKKYYAYARLNRSIASGFSMGAELMRLGKDK